MNGDDGGVVEEFADGSSKLYMTTTTGCNCHYRFTWGKVICKHLVVLRKLKNLPIFQPSLYGSEYIDPFMNATACLQESDEAIEEHFENVMYDEVEEIHGRGGCVARTTRYKQVKELTDLLAELINAAPSSLHNSYLDLLNKMTVDVRAGRIPSPAPSPEVEPTPSPAPSPEVEPTPSPSASPEVEPTPSPAPSADSSDSSYKPPMFVSNILHTLSFSFDRNQRRYIENNERLDSDSVNNFAILLRKQFNCNFQYQPCGISQSGDFKKVDRNTTNFQIIHLQCRDHFIMSSQKSDGSVQIYDSLPSAEPTIDSSSELYRLLSKLYSPFSSISRYCPQIQDGYVDCGLFACANLAALVGSTDPNSVTFKQETMRPLFLQMMDIEKYVPFEFQKKRGRKANSDKVQMGISNVYSSAKNLDADFFEGCKQPGRPKKPKTRHFTPSFNRK